jgi:hypothetical protein
MNYWEKILGKDQAAGAEAACVDSFVKQASAEGVDLGRVPDADIHAAYVDYREKWASAQVGTDTADSIIEKAAAEGASDEMLEKLALAKLSGEAMFEGYRESWEKFAQEQAAGEAAAMPPEVAAPEAAPEVPAEGGGGVPEVTQEEAQAIVEEAAGEAIEEVAAAAPADAAPEDIAAAAAEVIPEKVEEKVSAVLQFKQAEFEKSAGKASEMVAKGKAFFAKHPRLSATARYGGAAAGGAAAGAAAAKATEKKKHAADILAESIEKDAGPVIEAFKRGRSFAKGNRRFPALRGLAEAGRTAVATHPKAAKGLRYAGAAAGGAAVGAGAVRATEKKKHAADILAGMLEKDAGKASEMVAKGKAFFAKHPRLSATARYGGAALAGGAAGAAAAKASQD